MNKGFTLLEMLLNLFFIVFFAALTFLLFFFLFKFLNKYKSYSEKVNETVYLRKIISINLDDAVEIIKADPYSFTFLDKSLSQQTIKLQNNTLVFLKNGLVQKRISFNYVRNLRYNFEKLDFSFYRLKLVFNINNQTNQLLFITPLIDKGMGRL